MTRKLLIIISAMLLPYTVTSCAHVRDLPDPAVSCPAIPGELMKAPVRPHTIGNNE